MHRQTIKKALLLAASSSLLAFAPIILPYDNHNLLILLDDTNETIGSENLFVASKLLSGLLDATMPILLSKQVWLNFLEMRHEFKKHASDTQSSEYTLSKAYNKLNNTLDFWLKFKFIERNSFYSKAIALYLINKISAPKFLTQKYPELDMFIAYALPFYTSQWHMYQVTPYLYVLIPKELLPKTEKLPITPTNKAADSTQNLTQNELRLGLKIDHLEPISEPENLARFLFESSTQNQMLEENAPFVDPLSQLFITINDKNDEREESKEIEQEPLPMWNIILVGHGINYRRKSKKLDLIANLPITEFKNFLHFLQSKIRTNALFYATCYAGGDHLSVYETNGKPDRYNFTIITPCLHDSPTSIYTISFAPTISEQNILSNSMTNQYYLAPKNISPLKSFTEQLEKVITQHDESDIPSITKLRDFTTLRDFFDLTNDIENSMLMRFPGSDRFILPCPEKIIKIDRTLVETQKAQQSAISITETDQSALLQTAVIDVPINLTQATPFYSLLPGASLHYFEEINAPLLPTTTVAINFLQHGISCFEKQFLIKKLICKNNLDTASQQLIGNTKKIITLKNIIITASPCPNPCKYCITIFFQNEKSQLFTVKVRSRLLGYPLEIRGLSQLPNPDEYFTYFNTLKEKAFTATPPQLT